MTRTQRKPGAYGFEQELIENKAGFLQIQAMQIQMRLDGKSAGAKIIQIETAVGMDRPFDVFGRVLDLHVAVAHKLFESAQRVLLFILRLDLDRRTVVKRYRAPAE